MNMRFINIWIITGWMVNSVMASPLKNASPPIDERQALQWMSSTDRQKRQAALRSFRYSKPANPEAFLEEQRLLLRKAYRAHRWQLAKLTRGMVMQNPLIQQGLMIEDITSARWKIWPVMVGRHDGDHGVTGALQDELSRLSRDGRGIQFNLTQGNLVRFDDQILQTIDALMDIEDAFRVISGTYERPSPGESIHQRRIRTLRTTFDGQIHFNQRQFINMERELVRLNVMTSKLNDAVTGRNNSRQEFANYLNQRRTTLGLAPFLYHRDLATAAEVHAKDMSTRGFFSSQSPMDGRETPAKRAQRAGFPHVIVGELIAKDADSYAAAYQQWFRDDESRAMLFGEDSHFIGIGSNLRHWVLLVGKRPDGFVDSGDDGWDDDSGHASSAAGTADAGVDLSEEDLFKQQEREWREKSTASDP